MPGITPRPDGCACDIRDSIGRPTGPCTQLTTTGATWRFDQPGPLPILLCDQHGAEYAGEKRITLVR